MKLDRLAIVNQYSQGDVGGAAVILTVFTNILISKEEFAAFFIYLERNPTIRGHNLYVFWNDICNQSVPTMLRYFERCSPDVLADACSRQDNSGIALVDKYLAT